MSTPEGASGAAQSNYGADQISILEGLEAVRKRPGMYIGDTGTAGLHHLVWETVDNSIDECMAGRATTVAVRVHPDGSVSITDDGSGIPVDPKRHDNPAYDGKPAVELVMTVLHAGGKFGAEDSAYKVSGGLHGVGISVVNALSEWLEVEIFREGKIHKMRFERGVVVEPLVVVGEIPGDAKRRTGTKVTFKPDPDMFPDTEIQHGVLQHRLRELAYLNPGVIIRLTDERVGADGQMKEDTFRYDDGLAEFVGFLNQNKQTLHEVIHFSGEQEAQGYAVEVALQYNDSYNEVVQTFANNIRTVDGGTHLSGFKTAITRALNTYSKRAGLVKEKDPTPSGDDLREGLAAVVSVKLPEPQFEGQTKGKLRNTDVEGFVSSMVSEGLATWLDEHPSEAKRICQKGLLAAQAREAARKARELTRRKSALESGSMPHKLRDCTTKDVDRSEMFIVEGDSAGGSATQGRNVETQAILPLRGKLLNVERARLDKILAFEEIRTLISALKCGIGEDFNIANLRYGRIIIMTDADVDGSHIRTLLLTFFFRQMPELIRRGRIYIAQPPLYQLIRGKSSQYVLNEREMNDNLVALALEGAELLVRDTDEIHPQAGEPKPVRTIAGDDVPRLVKALRRLDDLVQVCERRGIRFVDLLAARPVASDPGYAEGKLPALHARHEGRDLFAWSEEGLNAQLESLGVRRGDLEAEVSLNGDTAPDERPAVMVRELHETRELSVVIEELEGFGVEIGDYALTREEAVTGELLPTKYAWRTPKGAKKQAESEGEGESENTPSDTRGSRLVEAANVPAILDALLDVGRRGLEVKRFKGLGEMDPEQLWETTMDPEVRTLLRVTWDDATAADELFTVLMGENVEQRRTYIEEHALEVKSLDV
ncbi:MAG: DNA topoisomerase (ATP-hydrolyzing) subunit B [Planctomycetota bacterium]